MPTLKHLAAAALTMIGAALASQTAVAADAHPTTMKPLAGVSFDVGASHAVAYFEAGSGACRLTLMVADTFNGEDVPKFATIRYEVSVAALGSARFDTAVGAGLEFRCLNDAKAMSVSVLERPVTVAAQH
jgi:hypothetical protein